MKILYDMVEENIKDVQMKMKEDYGRKVVVKNLFVFVNIVYKRNCWKL